MPSPPPRVLFTIGTLQAGGSEKQLVALIEQLHPSRVHASVATLSAAADSALLERLRALGVPRTVLGGDGRRATRLASIGPDLAATLRRLRPHVVYAWLEQAALVTAPIARALRTPVAVARRNVSGPYAAWPRPAVLAIARAERLAAVVTANSEAVRAEAIRRGLPADRIRVVRNGHEGWGPLPDPSPDGGVALGYVARFRAEKGHLRLLSALAHVRSAGAWHVDLAGDGPMLDRIEAEIARRGLGERVRIAGPFDDPRAFWAHRHVGVLLSDHEGSPNALIEAGMAGRPLVGTAVGGIPEVVGPSGGFVVGAAEPGATAAALTRLIDDRDLRSRLGRAAHEHVAGRFSMEQFVEGHYGAMIESMKRARR